MYLNMKPKEIRTSASQESVVDVRTAELPRTKLVNNETVALEEYDPWDHRRPKQPIKLWMGYLNVMRTSLGAGILGFPVAISQCGIVQGPLLAVVVGLVMMHAHLMLLRSLYKISTMLHVPNISYRYGFRVALLHGPTICHCLGRHGPAVIGTFMILSQIGICSVFIDFTSASLRDLLDWENTRMAMSCLLIPYLVMAYCMKNLKIVSYISTAGNIMNVIGLGMMIYHTWLDPIGDMKYYTSDLLALDFALGTLLFNLSYIGVILSVEPNLEKPAGMVKWNGIVMLGMGAPIIISTIFGCLGYRTFGTMEENALRYLPHDEVSTLVVIGLYLFSVAFAYPIQCYPGYQTFLEIFRNRDLEKPPSDELMSDLERISRPAFVIITFIISFMIPFQAPFVAFVGCLCTTMLSLVFPAMMELCLMYPGPYGFCKFFLIKNLVIIVVALLIWGTGIYLCAELIYIRIVASSSPNYSNADYM